MARMKMPSNTAVQHALKDKPIHQQLQEGIADAEDPTMPTITMFRKPQDMHKDPNAQIILESFLERGGGYCVKKGWVVRVDTWSYGQRIQRAMSLMKKKAELEVTFEMNFATQAMHHYKAKTIIRENLQSPWIVFDPLNGFDFYGDKVTISSSISLFFSAFRRYKKVKVLIMHGDQISHRMLAHLFEAVAGNASNVTSVQVISLFSRPRGDEPEKGTPVVTYFCRDVDVLKGFENWNMFKNRSGMACQCFEVLPHPYHSCMDIGTWAATPSWNQPTPKITMVAPGLSLRNHFLHIYRKKRIKQIDVLDLLIKKK